MAVILMGVGEIAYWFPMLVLSGTVTGLATGAVGAILISKIPLKD